MSIFYFYLLFLLFPPTPAIVVRFELAFSVLCPRKHRRFYHPSNRVRLLRVAFHFSSIINLIVANMIMSIVHAVAPPMAFSCFIASRMNMHINEVRNSMSLLLTCFLFNINSIFIFLSFGGVSAAGFLFVS